MALQPFHINGPQNKQIKVIPELTVDGDRTLLTITSEVNTPELMAALQKGIQQWGTSKIEREYKRTCDVDGWQGNQIICTIGQGSGDVSQAVPELEHYLNEQVKKMAGGTAQTLGAGAGNRGGVGSGESGP